MLDRIKLWNNINKIEKHDALAHLFDLTETEANAYFLLTEHGILNVNEMGEKLSKDRTTTQKAITRLIEENLAHRRKINLAKGGIKYSYEAVPFSSIKEDMIKKLEVFYSLSRNKIYEL